MNVDVDNGDGGGVGGRTLIYERFNSLLQLSSLALAINLTKGFKNNDGHIKSGRGSRVGAGKIRRVIYLSKNIIRFAMSRCASRLRFFCGFLFSIMMTMAEDEEEKRVKMESAKNPQAGDSCI